MYHLEVELEGVGWVPADLLSEGTLLAFGIHAVIQREHPPRLLLMDDIDRGLHPKAQRSLIQQLREVVKESGLSLVASTHSPYVLDELPAEAVRVVSTVGGEGTRVMALTDHRDWAEWKDTMSGGEFWAYVGDDWLEAPR